MCRINILSSSLCAPDEWGELVPSFLTLKVRHLVAFTFYRVFYRVMVLNPFQCGFVLGDLESVSKVRRGNSEILCFVDCSMQLAEKTHNL